MEEEAWGLGSCGPEASGGKEVVPSLVLGGARFLGVGTCGGGDMAWFLGPAGRAAVVGPNAQCPSCRWSRTLQGSTCA